MITLFKFKRLFRYYLALTASLILFLLTQIVYHETRKRTDNRRKAYFEAQTRQLSADIERRLHHYVQILKGTQGLFKASTQVTRSDWHWYFQTIDVNKRYPGIQGIGFAQYIRPEELREHQLKVRQEGFAQYRVRPESTRNEYTSIVYLEPFDERNQRAFGFDMYSEPIRRRAMQQARDSNEPALSGKVVLVQETQTDVQSGFLLYLPLYTSDEVPSTVYERRQQLRGFVFSPFRAKDLMNNIIGTNFQHIDVEVYDGDSLSKQSLLYDKDQHPSYAGAPYRGQYYQMAKLNVYGCRWTLHFHSLPGFVPASEQNLPNFILFGGSLMSLLLFATLRNLAKGQQNADLLQSVTDHVSDALFMVDARGYCTFMNPSAQEMTGYTQAEISRQPLQQLLDDPSERTALGSSWPLQAHLNRQKEIRGHEALFRRKDGSSFQALCAARLIYENDLPVSILMEVRDITEEKRIRQEIQESVARQQLILDAMPQIAWTATPAGEVTYYNQRWYAYTGLSRESVGLGSWQSVIHPEESAFSLPQMLREAGGKEIGGIRKQFRQASDGTYRWHLIRATPIRNEDAEIVLWIGTCTDVHDETLREAFLQDYNYQLADINQQLQKKNEELIRINTDLDNFVYTASHDLKSPVVNIEGFVTVLSKSYAHQQASKETNILHMIGEAARKLKRTINDLTEITKVQKYKEEAPVFLSFSEVVEDVLQDLQQLIEQSGARLQIQMEADSIEYARKNLRSVVYNLISNALKYRSPDRPLLIDISTREEQDYLLFQIQDNGLGINARQKGKLFTMFKRFHAHVEGTGIGLYIVKRIIENHQGRIEVESEEDQGTTFRVWFRKSTA